MVGSSIAHYKISAKLGQGGMGEVYRATDTKLDREVAIKVLPEDVANRADRLGRFKREAKALARLNHPNVGAIYGLEREGDFHFLVLELIPGETLQERLSKGPLPIEDGLKIFQQIAVALEAAHEEGIVHRDLKPANVKVDPQGRVKVLDFGLAKAVFQEPDGLSGRSGSSASDPLPPDEQPTLTDDRTQPGRVMGTAAYMSPEQSRGQEVDRRTDVWAFGCCFYEALTGNKPFKGQTASDTMAEILKADPDLTLVPTETPGEVITLLRRCLEKNPRRRLCNLGDIALTLEDVSETSRIHPVASGVRTPPRPPSQGGWPWKLGAITMAIVALVYLFQVNRPQAYSLGRSLAVLPFENITGNRELDIVGDGLAEGVSADLRATGLLNRVPHHGLVKSFKGGNLREIELARELGVGSLVLGTITGVTEDLRINITLIDGATERILWARSFEASEDFRSVRASVVGLLLQQLGLKPDAQQLSELGDSGTNNPLAYAAYRRGLEKMFSFGTGSGANALQEFERASELDPDYVAPIVLLSASEWWPTITEMSPLRPREGFARAKERLAKAVSLEPSNGAVLWIQGILSLFGDWDWVSAYESFRGAIAAGSEIADFYEGIVWYSTVVEGREFEAVEYLTQGQALQPDNPALLNAESWIHQHFGKYDRAMFLHRKFRETHPGSAEWTHLEGIADCLESIGKLREARVVAEEAIAASKGMPVTHLRLASILARSGDRPGAESILTKMHEIAETIYVPEIALAEVYARLGRWNKAFELLEEGYSERAGEHFVYLRDHGLLELMGDQPRYWDLIERMNYPALPIQHPFYDKEQSMRFDRRTAATTVASSDEVETLAVLPFAMVGETLDSEGLGDGIALDLISTLRGVGGLRLTGYGESMRFKESEDSVVEMGRQLDVDHVLTGYLTREKNRLRVNVELFDVGDETLVWSEVFDDSTDNLLSVRSSIAQHMARELKVSLGGDVEAGLVSSPTANNQAYELYLKGRAAWNRRTIKDFEKAVEFYRKSLSLDPSFALSYAGLALVHVNWPNYAVEPPASHSLKINEYARKALELDPRLAEPHAALGYDQAFYNWNWELAEKELQVAIKLDPDSADAYRCFSDLRFTLGDFEEAIRLGQRAVELDPTPSNKTSHLGAMFWLDDRRARAISELESAIQRDPHHGWYYEVLAQAHLLNEEFEKAMAVLTRMSEPSVFSNKSRVLLLRAFVLAEENRLAESKTLLNEVEQSAELAPLRALVLHTLGEKRGALELLMQTVEGGNALADFFYNIHFWQGLYGEPGFRAVLRRLNLDAHIQAGMRVREK